MNKIRRLRLENWKNFLDVDVDFQNRVFILGPEDSGKSNFLDAIQFLKDIATVGFQHAVACRGGVNEIRCRAAKRHDDIKISTEIVKNGYIYRYTLVFNQNNCRKPIIRKELASHGALFEYVKRPNDKDLVDEGRLFQTYLEQSAVNFAFRPINKFFASIGGMAYDSELQLEAAPKKIAESRKKRLDQAMNFQTKEWDPAEIYSVRNLLWSIMGDAGPLLVEDEELCVNANIARVLPQMIARVQHDRYRQIFFGALFDDVLYDEGVGLDEVLLLEPAGNFSKVIQVKDDVAISDLVKEGHSLAEAVDMVYENRGQLSLF